MMYVLSIAMESALSDLTLVERGVAGANALAVATIVANTAATFMIELGYDYYEEKLLRQRKQIETIYEESYCGDGRWRMR
jgi:arginine exporter protein ArgO